MAIKKIIFFTILMLLFCNSAFAMLGKGIMTHEEATIGGLNLRNSTIEDFKRIYGQPSSEKVIQGTYEQGYISFRYGEDLKIVALKKNGQNSLCSIIVNTPTMSTPAGIGIGSVYQDLLSVYGEPYIYENNLVKYLIKYPGQRVGASEAIFYLGSHNMIVKIELDNTVWGG